MRVVGALSRTLNVQRVRLASAIGRRLAPGLFEQPARFSRIRPKPAVRSPRISGIRSR